jgi:hypothetical protein
MFAAALGCVMQSFQARLICACVEHGANARTSADRINGRSGLIIIS